MDKLGEGDWDDSIEEKLGNAIAEAIDDFGADFDEEGNPLEEGESDRIMSEEEREKEGRTSGSSEDDSEDDESGDDDSSDDDSGDDGLRREEGRRLAPVATQQDVKNRISSVKNIQKITRAMEMVAAARLRRAEQRIEDLRPYAKAIRRMTRRTVEAVEKIPSLPLLEAHESENKVGILLVTGDRGLAGAFNSQIIRAGNRRARELEDEGKEVVWYASGRRGVSSLTFRGYDVAGSWQGFTDRPAFSDARDIAGGISSQYIDGEVDRVEMIYNGYVSPLTQEVTTDVLLPLAAVEQLLEEDEEEERLVRGRGARLRATRRCGSTSPTPRRSSPGSCRTTSRYPSTGRCWSPPPPSTGPG